MQQEDAALRELGVRVCVVTFESEEAARGYAAATGILWPVLSDSDRNLYQAYGMGRLSWRQLMHPSALKLYLGEVLKGNVPGWPVADPQQGGGNVLIDPDGVVRLVHVGESGADRPTIQTLLDARRRTTRGTAGESA